MKKLIHILLIVPMLAFGQKAFPTAVGFGQNALGGRRGSVYFVTNLNGSGPGSFREGCNSGNRIIVFNISGNIDLGGSTFTINVDNLTILGQTAPGDGITLENGYFRTRSSNVIVRYLRFRDAPTNINVAGVINNIPNSTISDIIWDHCSITGGRDENWSVGGNNSTNSRIENVTIQNSIIGEGKDETFFYATLLGQNSHHISMIKNFWVNNSNRIPEHTYGDGGSFEFVNNLIYNYNKAVTNAFGDSTLESVGNVFVADSDWPPSQANHRHQLNNFENPGGIVTEGHVWQDDNLQVGYNPHGMTNSHWNNNGATDRLLVSPYTPILSSLVESTVINDVGPSTIFSDSYDARIFMEYQNLTGKQQRKGLTHPNVTSVTHSPDYDTDNDGMADQWEIDYLGGISATATGDNDTDGYTNIEEFSFDLAGEQVGQDSSVTPPAVQPSNGLLKGRRN